MNVLRKSLDAILCSYLVVGTLVGESAYADESNSQTPVTSAPPAQQAMHQLIAAIALYPDSLVAQTEVVCMPEYDPWLMYGAPIAPSTEWYSYPGLYWTSPGFAFDYNHSTYISQSTTLSGTTMRITRTWLGGLAVDFVFGGGMAGRPTIQQ
jgi:hypothetical protein